MKEPGRKIAFAPGASRFGRVDATAWRDGERPIGAGNDARAFIWDRGDESKGEWQ